MNPNNVLRNQVSSEMKKRRLIFLTVMFISFLYLAAIFIFGDTGLISYLELRGKRSGLQKELKDIEANNARLKAELKQLNENPFYLEKHARENFGMAKPDEYTFKYEQ